MVALRIEVSRRVPPVAHESVPPGAAPPAPLVERRRVYLLDGHPGAEVLETLCSTVLADTVVEDAVVHEGPPPPDPFRVEVGFLPGVTDTEARQLEAVIAQLGGPAVAAATVRAYRVEGADAATLTALATARWANASIERWAIGELPAPFAAAPAEHARVETVALRGLDDDALAELSRRRLLSLDRTELRAIVDFYAAEGREPTDAELETLAQTWSEHCNHKTFRARIDFTHLDADGSVRATETIDGLLRSHLRAATDAVARPWVRSAFVDNAGIVALDDRWDLAIKVETHNHPSALEPFGGANTGVGGVVRDVIGVSARPIACLDVLCFAPPDTPDDAVPDGVLAPGRIAAGVVAGIGDYGNKLGLPTVAGAVVYHPGYLGNPLVYCGAVGILPHGAHRTGPQPGDLVVVIGGRTGRDGIHGATFSSAELEADTATVAGTAVQIGDPITEKATMELVCEARDAGLYRALTDCGAGGLSSAVGELGAATGVAVDLATVPRKYAGLAPWEVWISEAQERMVLAVPPEHLDALEALGRRWQCEVTAIGAFTDDRRLRVGHGEVAVVDLPMAFLHDGCPRRRLDAEWREPAPALGSRPDVGAAEASAALLRLLADPTVASKADVIATYDHEVRGGTVVRPWCGPDAAGPSDGVVLVPHECWEDGSAAFALGVGINPRYGRLDPYRMAFAAVDEAFRNVVAAGADPDRVSLLDNFCWGNPNLADRLGALVRATQGCHDAALAYRAPFVSGKDSLFNEFDGRPIPPTLLITALGVVPDRRHTAQAWARRSGGAVFVVGATRAELGGSLYAELLGDDGGVVPAPVPGDPLATYRALHRAIVGGLVVGVHDCSEGGLAVALAEFALAGGVGLDVALPAEGLRVDEVLFSESCGRFVVQVSAGAEDAFAAAMPDGMVCRRAGAVAGEGPDARLRVSVDGRPVIDEAVPRLREAFEGGPRIGAFA
ncbi:MAG: phosphoribosylformylglycinamidine synthase subunit PurL [Acidimicrobiales bacterium]